MIVIDTSFVFTLYDPPLYLLSFYTVCFSVSIDENGVIVNVIMEYESIYFP